MICEFLLDIFIARVKGQAIYICFFFYCFQIFEQENMHPKYS